MIFYWSSLFLPLNFCLVEEEGPVVCFKYVATLVALGQTGIASWNGHKSCQYTVVFCSFFIAFLDSYQMVLLCFTHLSKKIKTALYCSNIQLIKFMVCLSTVLLWLLTRNQCLCKYIILWHHQNNVALILFLSGYIFAVMIACG